MFPSPVGDYDSSLIESKVEFNPSEVEFPSPVGDYDSSRINVVLNDHNENTGFRPLSGIMILHKMIATLKPMYILRMFPSPVGDYDSSHGQQKML